MPVSGVIQTGTYTISNKSSTKPATLNDANQGSNIIESSATQSDNVKWTITKLSNNNYNIMSYVWANYAMVGVSPRAGDVVQARSTEFQWVIRETSTPGVYLIWPASDNTVYWSFINSNDGTNVSLSNKDDDNSRWTFNRVQA